MAHQPQQAAGPAATNVYVPVIETSASSNLVVLNDNCILALDTVLSITGVGKVLSNRGHELYTLYNHEGNTLCQFEGQGLMQRTVDQIAALHMEHSETIAQRNTRGLDELRVTQNKLQRQLDALWYLPGNPGAKEAESDFVARTKSLQEDHLTTNNDDDEEEEGEMIVPRAP